MAKNRKYLIGQLEKVELDDRFTNITPVNCDVNGVKHGPEGALSVVFKADDALTRRPVALKFFDPDFGGVQQIYRLAAFRRESELLQSLAGQQRCLQMVSPLQETKIPVRTDSGDEIELVCSYFATEWVDEEVKHYFRAQDQYEALAKLRVFRDVCLAVFALHRNEIQHRDIKADNMMVAFREDEKLVIAIDLGTSAKLTSAPLGDSDIYLHPIGAPGYAPLEAYCGLARVRTIGYASDYYALGCLLYELFNLDLFYSQLLQNSGFQRCRAICERHMMPLLQANVSETKLLGAWSDVVGKAKRLVMLPNIDDPGSSVPAAIRLLMNALLHGLTAIDPAERLIDANLVLKRTDSGMKALQNQLTDQKQASRRAARREARLQALQRKQRRLMQYLERQQSNGDD